MGDWVLVTAYVTLSLKANNTGIDAQTIIPWIKGTILRSVSGLTWHGWALVSERDRESGQVLKSGLGWNIRPDRSVEKIKRWRGALFVVRVWCYTVWNIPLTNLGELSHHCPLPILCSALAYSLGCKVTKTASLDALQALYSRSQNNGVLIALCYAQI